MSPKTIDRRVLRTRTMLRQALLSLSSRRDYDSISVEDICEAANVGRSTFYAHYTSKDDLFRSGFEHLRHELAERQAQAGSRQLGFSLAMFEHAREHLDHYQALVGRHGGSVAIETIRTILVELVRREFSRSEAVPREFTVQYVVGAYLAVLAWWLDGGAKLPPQRVDAMFRRLAFDGVGSLG